VPPHFLKGRKGLGIERERKGEDVKGMGRERG